MKTKAIKRPRASKQDEVNASVIDLVDTWNGMLPELMYNTGKIFRSLALDTTRIELHHGLGRVPEVVAALRQTAIEIVVHDTSHPQPLDFIYVRASGPVTVTLVVA